MSRHKLFILGALICALIFTGGLASAQTNADVMFTAKKHPSVKDWSAIDNYASNLSFSTSTSYATAAAKICQTSRTEEEKARAIFAWIAHNIAYDVNLDSSFCYSADGVWRNRKGACQGYSLLYIELAKTVGLNCEYVSGNNKRESYTYKASLGSHGWVLVHLSNGKNLLMDPTWAAGNTDMVNKTFDFDYKDSWFDVDPYFMIMSHYPSSSAYQCLNPVVSREKFDTLPRVEPDYALCGIDGKELYDFYLTHNKAWAPVMMLAMHNVVKGGIKFNKLPMAGTLKKGETYTFNLTIPSGQTMLVKVGGSWQNLTSNKDFSAKPTSTEDLILGIGAAGGRIQYVLLYKVADSPSLPWANDAATINSRILASGSGSVSSSGSSSGTSGSANPGTQTPSPVPSNPSAGRSGPVVSSVTYGSAKYKGKNLTNLPSYTYTLRTGGKVTNQVSTARPKVLVFYATYCPYAKKLNTDLAANYSKFSDVDLYLVNAYNDSDDKISKYISDNNLSALKFTSGTGESGSEGKESFTEYGKLTSSGTGYPFVIFIDCNNKIQYELNGCPRDNPAQFVRNVIDNYLIPKEGLPQTNPGTTSPAPAPSPAPATPTAPAKTDGLNIKNSINATFTLLDGSKVTSKAEGKPKVLIFFQTICGRCQGTTKSLGPNYSKFSDVDIYEIEINRAKKADVQKFKDTYGSATMKFAYDEATGANGVMWQYIKLIQGNVNSIGLPVIVYIDSNNVIQQYETAKTVKYDHIREVIDGYLKTNATECEDESCEVPSPAPKPEVKPEVKPETKPSVPEKKPEIKPETKPSVPEKKPEVKPETKPSVPEKKPDVKPETKPAPVPEKKPAEPEKKPAPSTAANECEDGACEVPTPPKKEPEKDGANRKNPVSVSFPLVGGKSVSTTASGRPKILVFYATSCGRTKNFLKNINSEYGNFGAVDIIFVETRKAKESAVKSFRNKYALPEMNFAYDTSKNAKNAMDTYAKTFLPKVKTVNTPMIVFIDSDNMVQDVVHGKALTAKQFWEMIDGVLLSR